MDVLFPRNLTMDSFIPLLVSVGFYGFVFAFTEACRRLVDRFVSHKRLAYTFLMELFASAQMCTCVYENGVILKNYGVLGFFFIVICLLMVGGKVNRGAFVNPLPVLELFYKNVLSLERVAALLTAQLIGGGLAFRVSETIWFYTMDLISDHRYFYENLPCKFAYHQSLLFAMIYEVLGCFALRFLSTRLPYRQVSLPAMVSFLLSVAFVYVGVPALNPLTVSARMMNCKGLDQQMFFFTYWLLPAVGWFIAVVVDDYLTPAQKSKVHPKKTENKQIKKQEKEPKKQEKKQPVTDQQSGEVKQRKANKKWY